MTSKKQKKGKTMALSEFLDNESKLVTVRGGNWSEIVDNELEEETKPIVVDIGALPTAPRGATDVDYSTVPTNPPFIAHVANLSFEIDDEGLRRIFADLNPKAARVIRDGIRSRGIGLVEFETRENLIEGLKRTDKEIYGRKIRVNVSDKADLSQNDGGRGTFGNQRSNRGGTGEERPEMSSTWKRAEPRSDTSFDDRSSGGFNRDRQNRGDHGRPNMSGGSRDNQSSNDFGFGYPRSKDDRSGGGSGGGGRDYNRQGQRNRPHDDDNRQTGGADRPRYGGRYSDTRDTRDRNRPNDETTPDQQEAPRERPRLQLQPRSKPLEEVQQLSGSSSSVNNVAADAEQSPTSNLDDPSSPLVTTPNQQRQDSSGYENRDEDQDQDSNEKDQSTVKPSRGAGASIFGGAKPVDTAARELEIEKKLQETQITTSETPGDSEDRKSSSRPSYNRPGERDTYTKRSSNNDDYRDRRGDGRSSHGGDYHSKGERSGGRQYDDEGRKRDTDDYPPRRSGGGGGSGQDRDRYGGPPRRDFDSTRSNRSNPPEKDNDRGNFRNRNQDTNESSNSAWTSKANTDDSSSDFQTRQPQRGMARRIVPTEDNSNKLQLSNKFGMLDDDDNNEAEEDLQSPNIDD